VADRGLPHAACLTPPAHASCLAGLAFPGPGVAGRPASGQVFGPVVRRGSGSDVHCLDRQRSVVAAACPCACGGRVL